MNLCFITPSFYPTRGGTEQVIHQLSQHLSRHNQHLSRRHNATILTPNWGDNPSHETYGDVDVYRFKLIKGKLIDMLSSQYHLLRLFPKLMKKHSFDLIHQFHTYQLGAACIRLKTKYNLPLVTSLMGWDTYDPHSFVPKRFVPYLSRVMNHSNTVTSPSTSLMMHAMKQGCTNPITVIPHGISLSEPQRHIDVRKLYDINKDDRILLSLQRLVPRKNLGLLVRAMSHIALDNIKLIIGGSGPEFPGLMELSKIMGVDDRIIFPGFIPDNNLWSYYNVADLFVSTSRYEAFGVTFVDALSCGVPVVSTECGGVSDIVDSSNGVVVPSAHNEVGFAHNIIQSLETTWDKERIQRDAIDKYSYGNIVKEYERIYDSVSK